MKNLDPMVFVSVFQELLGLLFWPLVAFIVLGGLAVIVVIIREGGLRSARLVRAELVGLAGGFIAIAFMLWITNSRLADVLGGPVDWLLTIAIWVAGAIGATLVAYVGFAVLRMRRRAVCGWFQRARTERPRASGADDRKYALSGQVTRQARRILIRTHIALLESGRWQLQSLEPYLPLRKRHHTNPPAL
jgi:hypothetical protein